MQTPFNRRIAREIALLAESEIPNIVFKSYDANIIQIQINGAEDTLYQNESFMLEFILSNNYPIEAPTVIFINQIPINEHVYSNGHICMSVLYNHWSPALTIENICLCIISLLSSAKEKTKPINDDAYCFLAKDKSPKDFSWTYDH